VRLDSSQLRCDYRCAQASNNRLPWSGLRSCILRSQTRRLGGTNSFWKLCGQFCGMTMPSSGCHSKKRLCNWLQRSRGRWLQFCQSVEERAWFSWCRLCCLDLGWRLSYCTTICWAEEEVGHPLQWWLQVLAWSTRFLAPGSTARAASSGEFLQWAADLRVPGELDRVVCHLTFTAADEYRRKLRGLVPLRNLGCPFVFLTRALPPLCLREFEEATVVCSWRNVD
jgi:hypothetical protein